MSKQVPQTLQQVDSAVQEIGVLERRLSDIEGELAEQVAKLQHAAAAGTQPLGAQLAQLREGVQAFAETHRDELTKKSKTVKLPSGGELKWRLRPPRLVVSAAAMKVIETLERKGFPEFVRIEKKLDKEALKKEPDTVKKIPGLSIKHGDEEFIIKP